MYSNEHLNAIHFSKIGLDFEFFANQPIKLAKEELSNILNRKVIIAGENHNDFNPTTGIFKIKYDETGVNNMINLSTGLLPFSEAKLTLSKVLKWIRENGFTTDKCSLHVILSFDTEKLGTSVNMSKLDIGKFVLNFDEDKVYNLFPDRKDSIYAKSINFILPLGGMTQTSLGKTMWRNYMFVDDDFYAVDFTNMANDYINFKYIGGSNYENKYTAILSTVEQN